MLPALIRPKLAICLVAGLLCQLLASNPILADTILLRSPAKDVSQIHTNTFSIVLFSIRGCHGCQRQKQVLTQLQKLTGWEWHELDAQEHTELVEKFGIYSVPALVLFQKQPARWSLLATKVTDVTLLEKLVANAVLKMGRID